jgi:chaperonin cofactor prefoldin
MIKPLQNQVNSLQHRISDLETTLENSKYALSDILEAPRDTKNLHQGISTLKSEKSLQSANLLSNDSKVNLEVKEPRHSISESLSEDKIRPLEPNHLQMKIKALISQISSLWERFQNKRESKLFKKDFNNKLKGRYP